MEKEQTKKYIKTKRKIIKEMIPFIPYIKKYNPLHIYVSPNLGADMKLTKNKIKRREILNTLAKKDNINLQFVKKWDNANIVWKAQINPKNIDELQNNSTIQCICNLPNHNYLTNKNNLIITGNKIMNQGFFSILPYSFIIKNIF